MFWPSTNSERYRDRLNFSLGRPADPRAIPCYVQQCNRRCRCLEWSFARLSASLATDCFVQQKADSRRYQAVLNWQNNNCKTKKIKSKLEGELKLAILKKAALFESDDFKKYRETEGKKKAKGLIKKR